ncbi:MAG: chemotaxis protein CheB, partial [Bacteroidota bacterium]
MAAENNNKFPIVGIGASAGGLKAIEELLRGLPRQPGIAFIIVQHLSRRFKSLMAEILAKDTKMPILLAENGLEVKPDHIYLIPAGRNLTISKNQLVVDDQTNQDGLHHVIDIFFHSLGQDAQENAIAVILSGTGSDGSRGIRTIKESGGLVIVQEPKSGEFDGMPLSAMDTKVVDFVLPPKLIAKKLVELRELEDTRNRSATNDSSDDYLVGLTEIFELLRKESGVDFSVYKSSTIQRRIDKHMTSQRINNLQRYFDFLVAQPEKVKELFHEILIGVTDFFRDPTAFEALNHLVYPNLFKSTQREETRIWICGCASGEEVYSLAISMIEYINLQQLEPNFLILATDINERSLAEASKGQYPITKLDNLTDVILERYFTPQDDHWTIKPIVRDRIIFARNDATVDPPFINLDLVVCRNLLIYFTPETQRRILLNFHFGLNPGGFLWLGTSENTLDLGTYFPPLSDRWKVFQSKGTPPKSASRYSLQNLRKANFPSGKATLLDISRNTGKSLHPRNQRSVYAHLILEEIAPASALVDENFQILYLAGGVGKYLVFPNMEINSDLLNKVSEATVVVLRDGMERLQAESGPFIYLGIQVLDHEPEARCNLIIKRISANRNNKDLFFIEWKEADLDDSASFQIISNSNLEANAAAIIKNLQLELTVAQSEVQQNLEELETSNEELQASYEELIASNEELQSTNEELQSVNEELYTVNSELQARNRELVEAKVNIDNLLESTPIGTLFLDGELNIYLFTPPVQQIVPLAASDIGNSIQKYRLDWDYHNFYDDLQDVLINQIEREKYASTKTGSHFLVHLSPFWNRQNAVGVIVNLVNVTAQKRAENLLRQTEQDQRKILDLIPLVVIITTITGEIRFLNRDESRLDLEKATAFDTSLLDSLDIPSTKELQAALQTCSHQKVSQSLQVKVLGTEGNSIPFQFDIQPIISPDNNIDELLISGIPLDGDRFISSERFNRLETLEGLTQKEELIFSVKDDQFRYLYVSEGLRRTLNKPLESILGSNDHALFSEGIASPLRANDRWVLSQQKQKNTIESLKVGERKLHFMVSKFPMTFQGNPNCIGQVGLPLSAQWQNQANETSLINQEQWEELIKERTDALIETNQELRTITQSIAHDLRGPLRAILSFSELLDEGLQDGNNPTNQKFLDHIISQTKRMARILEGLLSFTKLGSIQIKKEWIDSKIVIQEIWKTFEEQYQQENDQLTLRDCPALWADLGLVKQVLENLVENSFK